MAGGEVQDAEEERWRESQPQCSTCFNYLLKDWNNCPNCGTEIPDSEFNTNPVGLWKVSTEGDCEGRSTKELGLYEGHIVEIAKALASRVCYALYFLKVKPGRNVQAKNTPMSVDITVSGMPKLRLTQGITGVQVTTGKFGNYTLRFD